MSILLAEHGTVCWLNQPLVFLRTHTDSLSCKSAEVFAYTSAESDFVENLKRVCASHAISINPDIVIVNMVRWFSENERAVLCRAPSLGKFAAAKRFVAY